MKFSLKKGLVYGFVIAAVVIALSACGGGNASESSTQSSQSEDQPIVETSEQEIPQPTDVAYPTKPPESTDTPLPPTNAPIPPTVTPEPIRAASSLEELGSFIGVQAQQNLIAADSESQIFQISPQDDGSLVAFVVDEKEEAFDGIALSFAMAIYSSRRLENA